MSIFDKIEGMRCPIVTKRLPAQLHSDAWNTTTEPDRGAPALTDAPDAFRTRFGWRLYAVLIATMFPTSGAGRRFQNLSASAGRTSSR